MSLSRPSTSASPTSRAPRPATGKSTASSRSTASESLQSMVAQLSPGSVFGRQLAAKEQWQACQLRRHGQVVFPSAGSTSHIIAATSAREDEASNESAKLSTTSCVAPPAASFSATFLHHAAPRPSSPATVVSRPVTSTGKRFQIPTNDTAQILADEISLSSTPVDASRLLFDVSARSLNSSKPRLMKGNVQRAGNKVLDFSATLRRDFEAVAPLPKEKKTENPLQSAIMLSGSDFLSTRVPSRKPRDFVSKNSPPRAPVAAGLPPVELYKSRRARQWEKDQEEHRMQLAAEHAASAAACNGPQIQQCNVDQESSILSQIPQKLLMSVLAKERQRQVFFAGVHTLSQTPQASLHSLQDSISFDHDHAPLSSWMDLVSSSPVPESVFTYAKSVDGSCASAAQQSSEWFSQKDTENLSHVPRRLNNVTPLMQALQRRKASASIISPAAAPSSSSTSSPSSPKSPQRVPKDAFPPPPMHLRTVTQQQPPSLPDQQRAEDPSVSVSQANTTEIPTSISDTTPLLESQKDIHKSVSIAALASDLVAFNSGATLSHAKPAHGDSASLHDIESNVLRSRSAWQPLSSQQAAITKDFWGSVEALSPSTFAADNRNSLPKNLRIIGRARSSSICMPPTAAASPSAPTADKKAAASAHCVAQVKDTLAKHRKILAAIGEQEKQWLVAANADIFFDIMNENGDNKCSFRELALWIRRNYHELHQLPVLLHAFEETIGATMSNDSFVSRLQFPQLLAAILHTARVWVIFNSMCGDVGVTSGDNKVLSRDCFAQGLPQMCDGMHAVDVEEHWCRISEACTEQHSSITFGVFCSWLANCDHNMQQQILKFSTGFHSNDAQGDLPAAYSIVKPHILNLKDCIHAGSVLNIEHFNLGPHEMAAWAPVFLASEVSEMRLSYNRIGAQAISSFLPALAGRSFGGIGDGVVKLSLSACYLDAGAAVLLARAISVAGNLESLDLSQNRCGDQGTMAICRALKTSTRLLKLNFRQNDIGACGGKEIGEMLASTDFRLRKLNVSWNSIKGQGAAAICRGLSRNKFLEHFDASWNCFSDQAALELGNALACNQSLQRANLEHCGVNDVAAVLIAYGLRRNSTVIYINLNMNPIGRNGAQAMLRHQRVGRTGDPRSIKLERCNLDAASSMTFNPNNPNGKYRLDLRVPLDRAVASELYELALRQEGENWMGETIDGRSFSAPEDYENPWVIPERGVLELRYFSTPMPPSLDDVISEDRIGLIISHVTSTVDIGSSSIASNDKAARDLLLSHSKEHVFSCSQVQSLLKMVSTPMERSALVIDLYSRIADVENKQVFLSLLPASAIKTVASCLGDLFKFDPAHPTGHYKLNLADTYQFMLAQKLQAQSNREARDRAALSLFDLSQRGNGQALRNTTINGEAVRISGTSKLPMEGELELDYSSFVRPSRNAEAVSDHQALFEIQPMLLGTLQMWNYSMTTTDLFKHIAQGQYCKSNQLVDWTLAVLEDPALQTFTPERRSIWAEDFFVFAHEMVVDWTNTWSACSRLPCANLKNITHRIGFLLLFNPMFVEGTYELDLSDRSHAIITRVLVDLSVKEPGENWVDETFNGRPFELPATWVEKIPDAGSLTLRYTVESWAIKRKARAAWTKYFQIAEFVEDGDDDFLGCCSCKLLPLLRMAGRDARVDLGWIKLRSTINGDINIALFVDSSVENHVLEAIAPHTDAARDSDHVTLPRQNSCLSSDLPTLDDVEDTIDQHGGWRAAGKFCFGVHVIAGRNMTPMDADGKSDPYIKIDVDGHSLQQTKIQPKTLNPQWDEKFIFILEPQQYPYGIDKVTVHFNCWDAD